MKPDVIPECLQGYDIDWSGYKHEICDAWHEYYVKSVRRGLDEGIAKYEKYKADVEEMMSARAFLLTKVAEVDRGFAEIVSFVRGKGKSVDDAAADIGLAMTDFGNGVYGNVMKACETIEKAHDGLAAVSEWANSFSEWKGDAAVIDCDMAFLKALRGVFENDIEVSVFFYALLRVEAKFRTKIFRELYRKAMAAADCISVVKNSKSVIKEKILGEIKEVYDFVVQSYERMIPMVKRTRKDAERFGGNYFADWNPNDYFVTKTSAMSTESIRKFAKSPWKFADIVGKGDDKAIA